MIKFDPTTIKQSRIQALLGETPLAIRLMGALEYFAVNHRLDEKLAVCNYEAISEEEYSHFLSRNSYPFINHADYLNILATHPTYRRHEVSTYSVQEYALLYALTHLGEKVMHAMRRSCFGRWLGYETNISTEEGTILLLHNQEENMDNVEGTTLFLDNSYYNVVTKALPEGSQLYQGNKDAIEVLGRLTSEELGLINYIAGHIIRLMHIGKLRVLFNTNTKVGIVLGEYYG